MDFVVAAKHYFLAKQTSGKKMKPLNSTKLKFSIHHLEGKTTDSQDPLISVWSFKERHESSKMSQQYVFI